MPGDFPGLGETGKQFGGRPSRQDLGIAAGNQPRDGGSRLEIERIVEQQKEIEARIQAAATNEESQPAEDISQAEIFARPLNYQEYCDISLREVRLRRVDLLAQEYVYEFLLKKNSEEQ